MVDTNRVSRSLCRYLQGRSRDDAHLQGGWHVIEAAVVSFLNRLRSLRGSCIGDLDSDSGGPASFGKE